MYLYVLIIKGKPVFVTDIKEALYMGNEHGVEVYKVYMEVVS